MNLKKKILILMFIPLLLSCASIQERWNSLSPDEKARIIVSDLQSQLETLFDKGKSYVQNNPQYLPVWKEKIVPTFDLANDTLKRVIFIIRTKGMGPSDIYQTVQPYLDKIIAYLIEIGAIK